MLNQDLFSQRCSKLEVKDIQWTPTSTPSIMQQSGPFYIALKTNQQGDDETWYKAQLMGVNKINSMMKYIIAGTTLETNEKRFSNHSARKTVLFREETTKEEKRRSACLFPVQSYPRCQVFNRLT